jgi:hypothetical protein
MRESDFIELWEQCSDEQRYGYVLNMALIVALFLLMVGVWAGWIVVWTTQDVDTRIMAGFGLLFLPLTAYVAVQLLRLRLRGRASAVLLTEDRLVWKDGARVDEVAWRDVSSDALDFRTGGWVVRTEGSVVIRVNEQVKRLVLFNPFMRLNRLETFVSHVLLTLKRLQDEGKKGGKKSKKSKKK